MKIRYIAACLTAAGCGLAGCAQIPHSYKPQGGYVPDSTTAISIAVAIWKPIYGSESIESQKPYQAELKKGVWYVSGSLKEGWAGGVAEAEIAKNDARIIRITHGR